MKAWSSFSACGVVEVGEDWRCFTGDGTMSCTVVFYLVSPGDLLVFHQESAAANSPPPPPPPGSVSSPLPVQSTQRSQNLQDSSGDSPVPSGSRGVPLPERHLEAVEVLRDLSRLRESFRRLGPRVAALEEGRAEERAERSRLQELVSSRGNVVQSGLHSLTSRPSMDGLIF